MPIRMTGMISGMDTESLVQSLVEAQKLKNKKTEDKSTLLTWKQDKWKELNTKLYKLYTQDISKMRLQGSYLTKAVTSSNDSLVEVTGGTTAPTGAHTITIDQLASSQYVTGGKLGSTVTTSSTLIGDLGMVSSAGSEAVITIKNGDKEKNLVVSSTTTLDDFIKACQDVDLNASYDKAQERLFISSKSSGVESAFTITSGEISSTGATALNNIKDLVNYKNLSTTDQAKIDTAIKNNDLATLEPYATTKAKADAKSDAITYVKDNIKSSLITTHGSEEGVIKNELREQIASGTLTVPDGKTEDEFVNETYAAYTADDRTLIMNSIVEKEYSSTEPSDISGMTKAEKYQSQVLIKYDELDDTYISTALTSLDTNLQTYTTNSTISAGAGTNLKEIGLGEITGAAVTAATSADMTVVKAEDSQITLDGAVLTGTSNTINANGLTINLKGKTAPGETITSTVSNNSKANYDMVKDFIKSYNEILKELNNLYYAKSARGYAPLSDDEKEAMTDDQIEKWETKIKDSILRRDTGLGSLITAMKTSMMSTVEVDGKKYALSSYGIQTSLDYTEKGLLHIRGDKDDATYAMDDDKLLKAFEEDPDTVIDVLSGISQNLYDAMNDKMKAIPNVSSALTFYNDKIMDKQQTEYKKRIAVLEDKLTDIEERYYKQFSAMETALAKMQSQSNTLASMMGMPTK